MNADGLPDYYSLLIRATRVHPRLNIHGLRFTLPSLSVLILITPEPDRLESIRAICLIGEPITSTVEFVSVFLSLRLD